MFKKQLPIIFIGLCAVIAALVLGWSVFVKEEVVVPVQAPVVGEKVDETVPDDVVLDDNVSNVEDNSVSENDDLEIDTSGWKTYKNEKYGYEVKYPEFYLVEDRTKKVVGDDLSMFPWYSRTDFLLNFIEFKNPNLKGKIAFTLQILNTTDKNKVKSSGGWEFIKENGIKKRGNLDIYLYSIDSGTNNMQVIFYNGEAYRFLHYLSEKDFNQILSTFKFIK